MIDVTHLKEMPESIVELGWSIKILPGKLMSTGVFPEPPDNVEVRRIRWQEHELNIKIKLPDFLLHGPAMHPEIASMRAGIHLLVISDGEQYCMDNIKDMKVTYNRRSPSFIGYGGISHFAHILFLPIDIW